jgi:hypothetical protein
MEAAVRHEDVAPDGDESHLNHPELGAPADPELVEACLRGNEGAWERLVERYGSLVFTLACRSGMSQDEAADVFYDTWAELWDRLTALFMRVESPGLGSRNG